MRVEAKSKEQEPNSLKAAVQTRHKLPLPICARLAWHSRNLASPIGTDRLPEQVQPWAVGTLPGTLAQTLGQ
ncbi:hypothetical protein XENTR_v10010710 [Xenopus tropicalis]|nr:hypothetical protein XENTR_v10010710 [Xenopus tropicalis]